MAINVPWDSSAYGFTFRSRFEREARSMVQSTHPNVVQVIDAGEDKRGAYLGNGTGLPYAALHYVEGCTLTRLLEMHRPLTDAAAAEVIHRV